MSQSVVERIGEQWWFWCPGCDSHHALSDGWQFNGDTVRPTFKPSVLSTYGSSPKRCHLYVEGGRIRYLNDCTHDLAGKTVDMEPFPEEMLP